MFLVYPTAELDHWTCRSFCKNSNSCEIQRDSNTLFALALDLLFIVPSPIVSLCSIFFCWFHQTFDQFFEPVTLVDNETRLIPRMDVPIHTMKIFKLLLLGR